MKSIVDRINENKSSNRKYIFSMVRLKENDDFASMIRQFNSRFCDASILNEFLYDFYDATAEIIGYDKISVDIHTGADYFYCRFKDGSDLVFRLKVKYDNKYEMFVFPDMNMSDKGIKYDVEEYYKDYVNYKFSELLKDAKLKKDKNKIVVNLYQDRKIVETKELEGPLYEIFNEFTSMNDKLKYINDKYWSFENEDISKVYSFYVKYIESNHFLNNAAKRGVTID